MERKVFVKSLERISRCQADPDYTGMFTVLEARRMTRLMKRATAVSRLALSRAGIAVPDAVIAGTGLGCIGNTEHFLKSLTGLSDEPLRPTYFMQSTHNTLASMIAIRLKCHGYNATYSHLGISFESALLDAFVQLKLGRVDHVLACAFEEMTPEFARILAKGGYSGFSDAEPLSETAVAMVLDSDPAGALCELADVSLSDSPLNVAGRSGMTRIKRADCVARYGDNFSVSALGACDAVELVSSGRSGSVLLENDFYGKSFATVLFVSICGR